MLDWRPLNYEPSRFFVKGTEFAAAFVPGTLSRFAIYETRAHDENRQPITVYRLRDAATVTLDEVQAGKRPAIVGTFAEPDEAVKYALDVIARETRS